MTEVKITLAGNSLESGIKRFKPMLQAELSDIPGIHVSSSFSYTSEKEPKPHFTITSYTGRFLWKTNILSMTIYLVDVKTIGLKIKNVLIDYHKNSVAKRAGKKIKVSFEEVFGVSFQGPGAIALIEVVD
jgi:hypothetical protein